MKLFASPTSVFARKVRIVIREKGLTGRVEEVMTVPIGGDPELAKVNPLSQLPALVGDDGTHWTDSSLIAAWLDGQGSGPYLLPAAGSEDYWRVRRVETAANGLAEMMAKIVYETRRPEKERSPFWLKRWQENLMRGFAQADAIAPGPHVFDMSTIGLAIAGTFCDFRLNAINWRAVAPRIKAINEALEERKSFRETFPS